MASREERMAIIKKATKEELMFHYTLFADALDVDKRSEFCKKWDWEPEDAVWEVEALRDEILSRMTW